jgi:hypothetical protein
LKGFFFINDRRIIIDSGTPVYFPCWVKLKFFQHKKKIIKSWEIFYIIIKPDPTNLT